MTTVGLGLKQPALDGGDEALGVVLEDHVAGALDFDHRAVGQGFHHLLRSFRG